MAMEEMPLSALFEQARKLHLKASDSRADQVETFIFFIYEFDYYFILIWNELFRIASFTKMDDVLGCSEGRVWDVTQVRGHGREAGVVLV